MRFGASTYFLKERSVTGALDVIARLGYASAEIWMEHVRMAAQRPATIARHARALGIGLTVHAASYDLNILSVNPGIRRESMRQVRAALRLAAAVDAQMVTVHPGALSSAREARGAAWRSLEETAAILDEWAGEDGLCVGLENMEKGNREIFCLPADVARLFAHPRGRLRLTLDLAHTRTIMDPFSYLREIRPEWIGHVHLSDNDPSATHLPLGHGRLPIAEILAALGRIYDGIVSLEGYNPGEGENLLAANMDYLRQDGLAGPA
jgi:sugar phosphate isomerase/epimerase